MYHMLNQSGDLKAAIFLHYVWPFQYRSPFNNIIVITTGLGHIKCQIILTVSTSFGTCLSITDIDLARLGAPKNVSFPSITT